MPKMPDNLDEIDLDDPRFRIRPYQQMVASCTGALVTSIFVTPLDVVKIRLQTQQKAMLSNKCFLYCNGLMDHLCPCLDEKSPPWMRANGKFNGTLDAFAKISKSEGVLSLWSGLSPTLVLAVPATIVYFVSYEQLRLLLKVILAKKPGAVSVSKRLGIPAGSHEPSLRIFVDRFDGRQISDAYSYSLQDKYNDRIKGETNNSAQPFWIPMLAGGIARIWAATLVSPLELIRTKMQSQKLNYTEIVQALKTVVRYNGPSGLWMGLPPTLLRDVPFSAIYWLNYETIKQTFRGNSQAFTFNLAAGAVAGSIAALVTLPFDVVKTHKQIEMGEKEIYSEKPGRSSGTVSIIRRIYSQNGIRGLFTGLMPRLVKVAPACAIMIATFEHGKRFFQAYNADRFLELER